MRLDFEKFLNENGLKIGDKVKLSNGKVCEICRGEDKIYSLRSEKEDADYVLSLLELYDFELVKSKKTVGDLVCGETNCPHCPLKCLDCGCGCGSPLREIFEITLKEYPQLEPMREYFEAELNKEVEE